LPFLRPLRIRAWDLHQGRLPLRIFTVDNWRREPAAKGFRANSILAATPALLE
jgi:hypothetical protein